MTTDSTEPLWKQVFKDNVARTVRPRPYGKKPDGNQDQSFKDEND
jgi:hypothetical protein